jgi:hypothetical protein
MKLWNCKKIFPPEGQLFVANVSPELFSKKKIVSPESNSRL